MPIAKRIVLSDSIGFRCPFSSIADNVENCGIPGNTTDDMWSRLNGDVLDKNPTVALVHGGLNDIWHVPNATPIKLLYIRNACLSENVKVILGTLLPCGAWDSSCQYPSVGALNTRIQEWNSSILGLDDGVNSLVVDYHSLFVNSDGSLKTELFEEDLEHPNAAGCRAMLALLEPVLRVAVWN